MEYTESAFAQTTIPTNIHTVNIIFTNIDCDVYFVSETHLKEGEKNQCEGLYMGWSI